MWYSFLLTLYGIIIYYVNFIFCFTCFSFCLHLLPLLPGFYVNIVQRVAPWNAVKLRDAVINGPENHPGATHYVDKVSTVKLPPKGKMLLKTARRLTSSRGAIVEQNKMHDYEFEGKVVYRHLKDGDIVLVNRQVLLFLI